MYYVACKWKLKILKLTKHCIIVSVFFAWYSFLYTEPFCSTKQNICEWACGVAPVRPWLCSNLFLSPFFANFPSSNGLARTPLLTLWMDRYPPKNLRTTVYKVWGENRPTQYNLAATKCFVFVFTITCSVSMETLFS